MEMFTVRVSKKWQLRLWETCKATTWQVNNHLSYTNQDSAVKLNPTFSWLFHQFIQIASQKKRLIQMVRLLKCSLTIHQRLWAVSILIHSASWPYQRLITGQAGSVCVWQVISQNGQLLMNWTQLKPFISIPPHYHSANGITEVSVTYRAAIFCLE